MENDLNVRLRPEGMAFRDEHLPEFRTVINLTVANQLKGSILIRNWLLATFNIDNTQPSMPKRDLPILIVTFPIRTSMG